MRGERDGAAHQGASVVTGKGHQDAATSQGMLGAVGNSRNQGEALDSAPEPLGTSWPPWFQTSGLQSCKGSPFCWYKLPSLQHHYWSPRNPTHPLEEVKEGHSRWKGQGWSRPCIRGRTLSAAQAEPEDGWGGRGCREQMTPGAASNTRREFQALSWKPFSTNWKASQAFENAGWVMKERVFFSKPAPRLRGIASGQQCLIYSRSFCASST